ncbi:LysR family transcriptional regulator, partial [Pseudomonas aeruginosa]|nr:LysR family transcriptional regulator [Pseudomonas aeruginosa]
MHDATSQFSHFRLAIATGVPSSCLTTLLALQRAEEPEVTITFFETSTDDLLTG